MKSGDGKSPLLFLQDILDSLNRLESYTHGMSFEDFLSNLCVQDAVLYNLQIIGEAMKKLLNWVPSELMEELGIPYKQVI